jgi:hypothetical protein
MQNCKDRTINFHFSCLLDRFAEHGKYFDFQRLGAVNEYF